MQYFVAVECASDEVPLPKQLYLAAVFLGLLTAPERFIANANARKAHSSPDDNIIFLDNVLFSLSRCMVDFWFLLLQEKRRD